MMRYINQENQENQETRARLFVIAMIVLMGVVVMCGVGEGIAVGVRQALPSVPTPNNTSGGLPTPIQLHKVSKYHFYTNYDCDTGLDDTFVVIRFQYTATYGEEVSVSTYDSGTWYKLSFGRSVWGDRQVVLTSDALDTIGYGWEGTFDSTAQHLTLYRSDPNKLFTLQPVCTMQGSGPDIPLMGPLGS